MVSRRAMASAAAAVLLGGLGALTGGGPAPAGERRVRLPPDDHGTRYEALAYVESMDDILGRPYAYLAYKETDVATGDWVIRIASDGATAGTVLDPDRLARKALKTAVADAPYFVHGFAITPRPGDPRRVETRVHVLDGKPHGVSLHLVTRMHDNTAKPEVTSWFPWPQEAGL